MKYQALLLTGPTGCGKTPLGNYFEEHGFCGRSCAHFDFGAQLRDIAARGHTRIPAADRSFIREVLTSGALLEQDRLPLAETIFRCFISDNRVTGDRLLILNGFPRHIDQARFMENLVAVRQVIYLCGSAEVICRRIAGNTGGDRADRDDDAPAAIKKKITIFNQRTLPLLDYYRHHGVEVNRYQVTEASSPGEISAFLSLT